MVARHRSSGADVPGKIDWGKIATGVIGVMISGMLATAGNAYLEVVRLRSDMDALTEKVHTIYEIVDRVDRARAHGPGEPVGPDNKRDGGDE
jgi:hypothetical protein